MGFQFGEKNWGFKCFLFLFFVFLVKSDRVREYDKRESVRECEVPIWNDGHMVLRWWRDDGEMVEWRWSRSSFRIGDLGFTRI